MIQSDSALTVPKPVAMTPPGTLRDPLQAAASPADSIQPAVEKELAIVMEAPENPLPVPNEGTGMGMSLILSGLFMLFCIIALRFRNNRKYVKALLQNLVETRMRQNVFDETVRESLFLLMLDLLWCAGAGILLWGALANGILHGSEAVAATALARQPLDMAVCMGAAVAYNSFMALAYLTVGSVFSDAQRARLWLKGFTASLAVMAVAYLPLALMLVFYPQWAVAILWTALIIFILAKLLFIWKGFKIFFNQISSWVLFLYYLCSLEIVPLILTYLAAMQLCRVL